MMASVGSSIFGSGTVSTRTSRLPCQVTAFIASPRVGVVRVKLAAPAGAQKPSRTFGRSNDPAVLTRYPLRCCGNNAQSTMCPHRESESVKFRAASPAHPRSGSEPAPQTTPSDDQGRPASRPGARRGPPIPRRTVGGWETGWKRSGRAVAARSPQDAFVHGAVRLSDADAFSACCRSCGSLKRVSSCSPDSG